MRLLLKVMKQAGPPLKDSLVVIPDDDAVPMEKLEPAVSESAPMPACEATAEAAEDYAALEALLQRSKEEAERLAEGIVASAKKEYETILQKAQKEAELIREQARQKGYEQGLAQKKNEIDRQLCELNQSLDDIKTRHQQFMENYAKELQNFSLEIAERILEHQVTVNEVEMKDLVDTAIDSVRDVDWLTVRLSDQIPRLVSLLREEYPAYQESSGKKVQIIEKDIPLGSCIIETPIGTVDASIQVQLENLKQFFARG